MRKILILFLFLFQIGFAQTNVVYISEPCDSMALINKEDIDIINKVFYERNILDSLHNVNEKIIYNLEQLCIVKDSIIVDQEKILNNKTLQIEDLKNKTNQITDEYTKELKRERRKKISFEALTGAGIITIILLILI